MSQALRVYNEGRFTEYGADFGLGGFEGYVTALVELLTEDEKTLYNKIQLERRQRIGKALGAKYQALGVAGRKRANAARKLCKIGHQFTIVKWGGKTQRYCLECARARKEKPSPEANTKETTG